MAGLTINLLEGLFVKFSSVQVELRKPASQLIRLNLWVNALASVSTRMAPLRQEDIFHLENHSGMALKWPRKCLRLLGGSVFPRALQMAHLAP